MVTTTRIALILAMIGFSGRSSQKEDGTAASPGVVARKQPKISLAVKPPTDPKAVLASLPLDIVCTVTTEAGGFDPSIVIFQISESKNKRMVWESHTVGDRTRIHDGFTFTYHTKGPRKAGRFAIDARVFGVDPSRPDYGPAPAPAADGTKAKPGARVELRARSLEVEVKSPDFAAGTRPFHRLLNE